MFEIVFFGKPSLMVHTRAWAPDDHHFLERFGIFTIIVLGEAFVKVLDDAQGTSLGIDQILSGVSLLTLLFAVWWIHFSDGADEIYDLDAPIKPFAWIYGHRFLAASLVMYGVAAKKLFGESIKDASKAATDEYPDPDLVDTWMWVLAEAGLVEQTDDGWLAEVIVDI